MADLINIYHGSVNIVEKPVFGEGKSYNDYGRGFYCTEHVELAKEWACASGSDGYANHYQLADMVIEASGRSILKQNDGTYTIGPEYWAGWVLAYYQWRSRRSFKYMHKKGLDINKVISMYYPLHEADLTKFSDVADDIIEKRK